MMKNTKGVTKAIMVIIVIIIFVIVGIAAAIGASITPQTANSDVTVYIDDVKQDVNYTQPQTLDWGSTIAGNVYTKNFNVTNTGNQNLTLMLLTTEPLGTTQSWAHNNSLLPPASYAQGSLTLTLSTNPSSGAYTWRLLATNNTVAAQPTPTPATTDEPEATYQFTIDAETGISNLNVTINANKIPLVPSNLPKTIIYHAGDVLNFKTEAIEGYEFAFWEIPGETPNNAISYTLPNPHGNFTITATYIVKQNPTT
jgi:hypothetical protein